jgi:hypothetical protein
MMKKSRIFQKKLLTSCGVMLLAIILVIVYQPQKDLAASLPLQNLVQKTADKSVNKTETNQEKEVKSAVHSKDGPVQEEEKVIEEVITNVTKDKTTAPSKDDANHQYNEMLHKHDVEDYVRNGRDLSNDPKYQAQLREIYSEDDLKRMDAPRRWVILPNVVGKTEVDAVKTMHATGITPRVEYEDGGKKEGTVIRQEIPGDGREWNTDASIFIYVQRSKKPVNTEPVKNVTEPTLKPTVGTPKTEQPPTIPSVEKPKSKPADDSPKPVEPTTKPSGSNEPIDTLNPEVPKSDTTQTTAGSV